MANSDAQALDDAGKDADDTLSNAPVETAVHKCREIEPEHELEEPPLLEPEHELEEPPHLEADGEVEDPVLLECEGEVVEDDPNQEGKEGGGGADAGDGSDAPADDAEQ